MSKSLRPIFGLASCVVLLVGCKSIGSRILARDRTEGGTKETAVAESGEPAPSKELSLSRTVLLDFEEDADATAPTASAPLQFGSTSGLKQTGHSGPPRSRSTSTQC